MYNQYLQIKPSNNGNGIFTTIDIPANKPIMEIMGEVYTENNLPDPNHPALIQVGPNTFIGPSGTTDDFINHSCNPNCFIHVVGNRAILYSMYLIKAEYELTFDYSTSSTDTLDSWQMNCNCGSNNCRKIISGFQYLDKSLQDEYKKKGIIPQFITHPIFLSK